MGRFGLKWVCGLALAVACVAWAEEPEGMRLFLLIGQSNMAGRGAVSDADRETDPRILMLNRENTWVPARDPVHFDKPKLAGVGLCSSFARAYIQEHPDEKVGLIPCAFGGTSLDQWMPGKSLYTNAVARARTAMTRGTLAGILWHQGEADCSAEKRERYERRFQTMIGQLRSDLDAQTVPLVVGELGRFYGHGPDAFNTMLGRLARRVPLCGLASSEGLADKGDKTHFDTPALKTFGERYYQAFSRLVREPVLQNGGLERWTEGRPAPWWFYWEENCAVDQAVKYGGTRSIRCDVKEVKGGGFGGGVSQTIEYATPDKRPIVFGGWSRAEQVAATDYCIYLDIWYEGGGNAWGIRADWPCGTHDWNWTQNVFFPEKPVTQIRYYAFLRNGTGKVWFDDLQLSRREIGPDVVGTWERSEQPFSDNRHIQLRFSDEVEWELPESGQKGKGRKASFTLDSTARLDARLILTKGDERIEREVLGGELTVPRSTVPAGRSVIWTADAMRKITPLTFPTAAEQAASPRLDLELARNGHDSAQILVSTAEDTAWRNGDVTVSAFTLADGTPLKGSVTWERVGYLAREPGYAVHPEGPPENELWLPDPLLPPAPFKVLRGATQGVWLTAYAAPDASPGRYTGTVRVTEQGEPRAEIPVTLLVRSFAQPKTFGMPTAFSVMDGFTRAQYRDRFAEMKRQSHALMLDYRLNPDDISRTEPPAIEDLLFARERGMNRFNILNIVPKPTHPDTLWVCYVEPEKVFNEHFYGTFKARLAPYVAELRKHGLEKFAYLYGFDERRKEYYEGIDRLWKQLRRDFPDIPVMTTAMMYADTVAGHTNYPCLTTTDWFCPLTATFRPELTEKLHAMGKQVWWYTCCGPRYPYANMASLEYPPIEGRLLGWMTHLYRSDGLLFWHVNYWHGQRKLDERETFFPDWHTYSSLMMPGDGIFLYPGENRILPGIRLAQIRDGVEDYEWLQLAAARKGAEAADAFSRQLIQDMTHFTRDPALLRRVRHALGDMIEKLND